METIYYAAFAALNVIVAREVNVVVTGPYMDEPFHVPQAQAFCRGEWSTWDPKLTTPPGLYILSILLRKIFLLPCTLPILRLTNLGLLLLLPLTLSYLLAQVRHVNPPRSFIQPTIESLVLSSFPVAWFFAFLYYTELGSLVFVLATILMALKGKHWLAGLFGLVSCTFRQTNIIWVLYALAFSALDARHRANPSPDLVSSLYDPPARSASLADIPKSILSLLAFLNRPSIIQSYPPYIVVMSAFVIFIIKNGGIVLGDKQNHIPSLHIPQLHYFIAFSTIFGLPILISAEGGPLSLASEVVRRMFGSVPKVARTVFLTACIAASVHFYTIHHPFLLADNRHFTFYVWHRIYLLHPAVPYLMSPGYLACYWLWFLRLAPEQNNTSPEARATKGPSLLQILLLPAALLPTLLPTPLLEPRYFLIPYVLLRTQVGKVPTWALYAEGAWYGSVNWATMFIFLYKERVGVGRFMW